MSKRIYKEGYRLGKIYIHEELNSISGRKRFILKCEICKKESKIWAAQLSTGEWEVCEHDTL